MPRYPYLKTGAVLDTNLEFHMLITDGQCGASDSRPGVFLPIHITVTSEAQG